MTNGTGEEQDISLLLVTRDLSDGSLGRAYCLWLIARELGWKTTVVSLLGDSVWAPLAHTRFARECHRAGDEEEMALLARQSSLIIAVKPLPDSFGVAVRVADRTGVPLLLDIDDPDLEFVLGWHPFRLALGLRLFRRDLYRSFQQMAALAPQYVSMSSNPSLAARHDSLLMPHVRQDPGPAETVSAHTVAFVGTPRRHKGVTVLRHAIESIPPDLRPTLIITAPAPDDAHPWEQWIGVTSLDQGLDIVRTASVIAIPSLDSQYAEGQLPVKLIDAMMSGKSIVASDLPPIRWALDGDRCGTLVRPGDTTALAHAIIDALENPHAADKAHEARTRALQLFTPSAQADSFDRICRLAMNRSAAAPTGQPPTIASDAQRT